jgi:hypothetical protein
LGVLGQKAEDYCEQKLQELQLSFTKTIDQVTERMQADLRHSSGRGDESDESDASTSHNLPIRSSTYHVPEHSFDQLFLVVLEYDLK